MFWVPIFTTAAFFAAAASAPSQHKTVSKRGPRPENIMKPLEFFVCQLKLYVSESEFYDRAFDLQQAKFQKAIDEIRAEVAKVPFPNLEVAKQFEFASEKYGAMLTASTHRKLPADGQPMGKSISQQVNDLSIFLLKVQDCHGNPDPSVERYAEIVAQFRDRIKEILEKCLGTRETPLFAAFRIHTKLDSVMRAVEDLEEKLM